ncbi:MAG: BatA and WFA domain-containing protein [Verrucomicrobiae bacterium]|nr:BatA and WFA domain-containing protein [Verrucomicrobiae bacterium]
MQFLNPGFLWLSLLAIIPIALYLFRRKSKRVDVSTLVFFKTLAREHQESAWLRRLKKIVSLLLTLALLLGAIFALSRLILSPVSDEGYRTVVVLLDRSASMAAVDDSGISRLDRAKEIVAARLESVPEDVGVALIGYDTRPEVIQPRTLKRRELLSRLDQITVRPVAQQTRSALDAAIVLARLETPALIWHVTDSPEVAVRSVSTEPVTGGPDAELAENGTASEAETSSAESDDDESDPLADAESALELPDNVDLERIGVALEKPVNAGITAFRIRPVPLEHGRFEAYVQVSLNADAPEPVTGKLDVFVGAALVQPREVDLNPGDRIGLILKLEGAEDQMLRLKLSVDGDCLATDNEVIEPLPNSRPIVVAWVRPKNESDPFQPDLYTQFALRAFLDDYDFEILALEPEAWPSARESVDVAIFDDCVPEQWPDNMPVVLINPPGDAGPIQIRRLDAGVPHESVRVANDQHPVLFRVSSGRVSVTQTAVFDIAGSLEPLWFAGDEPLLAAGDVKGQRFVVMGFSPGRSERLPLTASFPLLIGNALLWCAESAPGITEKLVESPTGGVVPVKGQSVTWTRWEDGGLKRASADLQGGLLELDRVGVWETDTGQRGAAHLLSRAETDLRGRDASSTGTENETLVTQSGWLSGDVTWMLLVLIAFVLILESYLFHRHAVY